jgi:hypothetical protein
VRRPSVTLVAQSLQQNGLTWLIHDGSDFGLAGVA